MDIEKINEANILLQEKENLCLLYDTIKSSSSIGISDDSKRRLTVKLNVENEWYCETTIFSKYPVARKYIANITKWYYERILLAIEEEIAEIEKKILSL